MPKISITATGEVRYERTVEMSDADFEDLKDRIRTEDSGCPDEFWLSDSDIDSITIEPCDTTLEAISDDGTITPVYVFDGED